MGLSVQCACGNPLEGENLDLVVTLNCPHCRRELTLELDDASGNSRRPVLTIVQGPHWVGQQFIVPVGVDLSIGSGPTNWIALDDRSVADVHCRLKLLNDGGLIIEDQKSASGTWVGAKRIARGKLIPSQPFRLGSFQLRMDLRAIEAAAAPVTHKIDLTETETSVRFDVTKPQPALIRWIVRDRFQISRLTMFIGAWLMGLFHAVAWAGASHGWGPRTKWSLGALAITGMMLASGTRVSLAHRHFKYTSLLALVVLVIVDLCFGFQGAAIACLCIAACLTILVMRIPTGFLAVFAAAMGLAGLLTLAGATLSRIIGLATGPSAG